MSFNTDFSIDKIFKKYDKTKDNLITKREINASSDKGIFDLNGDGRVDDVEIKFFGKKSENGITRERMVEVLAQMDEADGKKDGNYEKGLQLRKKLYQSLKKGLEYAKKYIPGHRQVKKAVDDIDYFEVNNKSVGSACFDSNENSISFKPGSLDMRSIAKNATCMVHELIHKVQKKGKYYTQSDEAQAFYYQALICKGENLPAMRSKINPKGAEEFNKMVNEIDKLRKQGFSSGYIMRIIKNDYIPNMHPVYKTMSYGLIDDLPDLDNDGQGG